MSRAVQHWARRLPASGASWASPQTGLTASRLPSAGAKIRAGAAAAAAANVPPRSPCRKLAQTITSSRMPHSAQLVFAARLCSAASTRPSTPAPTARPATSMASSQRQRSSRSV